MPNADFYPFRSQTDPEALRATAYPSNIPNQGKPNFTCWAAYLFPLPHYPLRPASGGQFGGGAALRPCVIVSRDLASTGMRGDVATKPRRIGSEHCPELRLGVRLPRLLLLGLPPQEGRLFSRASRERLAFFVVFASAGKRAGSLRPRTQSGTARVSSESDPFLACALAPSIMSWRPLFFGLDIRACTRRDFALARRSGYA